jgi:hypothetical protein
VVDAAAPVASVTGLAMSPILEERSSSFEPSGVTSGGQGVTSGDATAKAGSMGRVSDASGAGTARPSSRLASASLPSGGSSQGQPLSPTRGSGLLPGGSRSMQQHGDGEGGAGGAPITPLAAALGAKPAPARAPATGEQLTGLTFANSKIARLTAVDPGLGMVASVLQASKQQQRGSGRLNSESQLDIGQGTLSTAGSGSPGGAASPFAAGQMSQKGSGVLRPSGSSRSDISAAGSLGPAPGAAPGAAANDPHGGHIPFSLPADQEGAGFSSRLAPSSFIGAPGNLLKGDDNVDPLAAYRSGTARVLAAVCCCYCCVLMVEAHGSDDRAGSISRKFPSIDLP